jgi:hypothetical protein
MDGLQIAQLIVGGWCLGVGVSLAINGMSFWAVLNLLCAIWNFVSFISGRTV